MICQKLRHVYILEVKLTQILVEHETLCMYSMPCRNPCRTPIHDDSVVPSPPCVK